MLLIACNADKESDDVVDTDGTTETDGCPTDELAISPGTGAFEYVPLADGDPVTIVHGPQGGWHIWVAGALTGTAATSALIAPTVVVLKDGTQLAGDQEPQAVTVTSDGCGGTFFGGFAYLDDYAPDEGTLLEAICRLEGEILDLTVAVTDPASGATSTASVEVVAVRDAYDDAFCK